MPQPRVTPQQDPPLLRSPYRHTPAQADNSCGMRVILTGTDGGPCHLRDATNILATSRFRYECMPVALGRRMADRTRARSQSYGVDRTAPPELGREQRSWGLGWWNQVALLCAV